MRRDNVVLGGTKDFVLVRRQCRGPVRCNLAQQAGTVFATHRHLLIAGGRIPDQGWPMRR